MSKIDLSNWREKSQSCFKYVAKTDRNNIHATIGGEKQKTEIKHKTLYGGSSVFI